MKRKELRKILEDHKDAAPDVRRQLFISYADWIARGAKAQGAAGRWGAVFLGLCVFTAVLLAVRGIGAPLLYGGCGVGAVIGSMLVRIGWVRERDWRRANPFRAE